MAGDLSNVDVHFSHFGAAAAAAPKQMCTREVFYHRFFVTCQMMITTIISRYRVRFRFVLEWSAKNGIRNVLERFENEENIELKFDLFANSMIVYAKVEIDFFLLAFLSASLGPFVSEWTGLMFESHLLIFTGLHTHAQFTSFDMVDKTQFGPCPCLHSHLIWPFQQFHFIFIWNLNWKWLRAYVCVSEWVILLPIFVFPSFSLYPEPLSFHSNPTDMPLFGSSLVACGISEE